jgi:5-methylcytosine-specific restriction endonuclease McrA
MLKEEILKLKSEGKSYKEISEILGCAKSTISYHCNDNVRKMAKENKIKQKESNPFIFNFSKRVSDFKTRKKGKGFPEKQKDWNKKFRTSVSRFKSENKEMEKEDYSYKDALEYLGGTEVKCYLTGEPINIEVDDYVLDHIVPLDSGGTGKLSNMGITTPVANRSKSNLSVEEYINLCQKVLKNFGYTIIKDT